MYAVGSLNCCTFATVPSFPPRRKMLFQLLFVVVALSCHTVTALGYPNRANSSSSLILYAAVQSRGVLTLEFDPTKNASSSITILDTNTQGGFEPGWLHLRGDKLYSISREKYSSVNDTSGGLFSFSLPCATQVSEPKNYGLDLVSSTSSDGRGGVFVDVNPDGRTLSAANM